MYLKNNQLSISGVLSAQSFKMKIKQITNTIRGMTMLNTANVLA